MLHRVVMESSSLNKALKDASLYVAREGEGATGCVMLLLNAKLKSLSIIACDGRGYYERSVKLVLEKGIKPSLPGKPMHIFIPRGELQAITKMKSERGEMALEVDDTSATKSTVILKYPDGSTHEFTRPVGLEIPDYAGISKKAEKGRKSSTNLGQVMLPVKELRRAGKVFPVNIGETVPMYISEWKRGGLLTLLEYQSEWDSIRVIFTLSLPEAA